MRFAGWDKGIKAEANMDAFLAQAAEYRAMVNDKTWNKALEFMILSKETHPLVAYRATECGEWAKSDEFYRILMGMPKNEG